MKKASVAAYSPADLKSLPDFPLPLPRCTFATKAALPAATIREKDLRKYLAGRTKYKNVYTITVPTTTERLKGISRLALEDDYIAPSGFCTPKSAQAFIAIRKIVYAALATLPTGGYTESVSNQRIATDFLTFEYDTAVTKKATGIEEDETRSIIKLTHGGLPQGIQPREIKNIANAGYHYVSYFKGSVGSDKLAIRKVLVSMAKCLDPNYEKALRVINSLLAVADKALEGEHGRVVGHMAHMANIMAEAGMYGHSLVSGGEYIGVVVIGSIKSMAIDCFSQIRPAMGFDELVTLVGKASTAQVAKERIAALLSDLEIDEAMRGKDGMETQMVEPEDLTSSYIIWRHFADRHESFSSSDNHRRVAVECLSALDFSEDVRREFTPEGFRSWLDLMANEYFPYSNKDGEDKYMNITGINFSDVPLEVNQGIFGGVSYSPVWPGGRKFVIPAPGAADSARKPKEVLIKKGDRIEKEQRIDLESLVFIRCTPAQAAKDWKLVFESGSIWQPEKILTRKEKLNNVVWSGDILTNAWESLKEFCHKEGKGKEPEAKKAKVDEGEKGVPSVVTDLSSWSAF